MGKAIAAASNHREDFDSRGFRGLASTGIAKDAAEKTVIRTQESDQEVPAPEFPSIENQRPCFDHRHQGTMLPDPNGLFPGILKTEGGDGMHETMTIFGIVVVILGYGYFSKLYSRFNLSGPMIFTTVGVVLSPLLLGDHPVGFNSEAVQTVAEIALIVVLFSDAATLNLKRLRKSWKLPARLLALGLPITIIFAAVVARFFFPGEDMVYLLLLALILAPTDAALGKAVVSDPTIPEDIRSTINVESGLNDGIVFPVFITVVAMIAEGSGKAHSGGWLAYVARQILIGGLLGAVLGYVGAELGGWSIKKGWMENSYKNLVPFALAVFSYFLAEHLGGNGYIAAFSSGLLFGNTNEELRGHVEGFSESEGELLIMISFLVFGLVFVPFLHPYWSPTVWVFAVLSLTLFRMIPVALGFLGSGLKLPTVLFIGWFGPRGIASILYVLIAVGELGSIKGHETIYSVAALTILLSIFLHGLSARPLAAAYSRRLKKT